jgi:hypothetical protein
LLTTKGEKMKTRREFLKETSATLAFASIAPKIAALYRSSTYNCNADFVLDNTCKPVMTSSLGNNEINSQLKFQWRSINGPNVWAGDNIQMHNRYAPLQQGVKLDTSAFVHKSRLHTPRNKVFSLLPNAVVTSVRPFGMLINIEKLQNKGIDELSLQSFARKSVKPIFTVNSSGYAPENCWLTPMVRSAGLFSGEVLHEDKNERDVERLQELLETHIAYIKIDVGFGLSDTGQYDALTDPLSSDTVAIFGDPILLQKSLEAKHINRDFSSKYRITSLQDFMGFKVPSFFTSQMLQVGEAADVKGVNLVLNDLTRILAQTDAFDLAVPQSISGENRTQLKSVWSSLQSTHAPSIYADTPDISYITDGGLLSRFAIDLQAGLQLYDPTSLDYMRNTAANAIWRSRRKWMLRQKLMSGNIV